MTAPICHGSAGGCIASHWTHLVYHSAGCPVATYRTPAGHVHVWTYRPDKVLSDCPCGAQAVGVPFIPPAKRAMGQCSEECQKHQVARFGGTVPPSHLPDCPALYPLQRQPGDEKDALTRLTAHCRGVDAICGLPPSDSWETKALDLISEAREEQKAALAAVVSNKPGFASSIAERVTAITHEKQTERLDRAYETISEVRAELARAKALVTTLTSERDAALAGMTAASKVAKTLTLHQTEVRQRALNEGRDQGHVDAIHWTRKTLGPGMVADLMAEALDALRGDS